MTKQFNQIIPREMILKLREQSAEDIPDLGKEMLCWFLGFDNKLVSVPCAFMGWSKQIDYQTHPVVALNVSEDYCLVLTMDGTTAITDVDSDGSEVLEILKRGVAAYEFLRANGQEQLELRMQAADKEKEAATKKPTGLKLAAVNTSIDSAAPRTDAPTLSAVRSLKREPVSEVEAVLPKPL